MLDRADNCINLIEIKFATGEYVLDKTSAAALDKKKRTFAEITGTRKSLFTVMLTTYGVKKNEYFYNTVQQEITMEALFEEG